MEPELLQIIHELIWFSGACLMAFSKLVEIGYMKKIKTTQSLETLTELPPIFKT